VSLQVVYEEKAIDQAAGFLADDPRGLSAVLDAIDQLASDPRPAGSFPYGSPDLRRLRVGRYQVMYEIKAMWCRSGTSHGGRRTADPQTAEPRGP
jgi:mRNA interferase RelE/StbE